MLGASVGTEANTNCELTSFVDQLVISRNTKNTIFLTYIKYGWLSDFGKVWPLEIQQGTV